MARNLEVHTGNLHYCTFRLEAAEDAQNVEVYTRAFRFAIRIDSNHESIRIYSFYKKIGLSIHSFRVLYNE